MWQYVITSVGVVIAAVIAGSFAVRNARKTPHETLKTLVEIAEKLPDGINDHGVLNAAIDRELRRIGLLNQARIEGRWHLIKEQWRQADLTTIGMVGSVSIALLASISAVLVNLGK